MIESNIWSSYSFGGSETGGNNISLSCDTSKVRAKCIH